mmetsp:Transcript_18166/g.44565  ORF Transcript_18166/g.44565 Transcript_18166/m.44565 type:complete len:221 (+) Transcript_18166:290-952(+)
MVYRSFLFRTMRSACSIALPKALILFIVSSYSGVGSESNTIPPPACKCATPSFTANVRIAMQVSMLPLKLKWPTAPEYTPRLCGSSPLTSCIALTFGAPLTVPAGKTERKASYMVLSFASLPETCDTMCITWEYRSMCIRESTLTVPGAATLPTSFRPRSTSMMCSARSFSFARSSFASASSCSLVLPLLRVPAMGWVVTTPFTHLTRSSGEAPTIWKSS